ncbi:MAG: SemiSWEET family sugar transporter [Rhodobacterales bacterium]
MTPLYIGYAAAMLGTICWIPQALQVWRTRDTRSLSLSAQVLFLATVTLWLAYGVMIMDWPLILANIVSVSAMIAIVTAKLKFK